MRFYIEGTDKWTEVRIRKWNGRGYGEDFSNEILIILRMVANILNKKSSIYLNGAPNTVMNMTVSCL